MAGCGRIAPFARIRGLNFHLTTYVLILTTSIFVFTITTCDTNNWLMQTLFDEGKDAQGNYFITPRYGFQ